MNDQTDKTPRPNTESGWLSRERALALVLLVVTALAVYVCY